MKIKWWAWQHVNCECTFDLFAKYSIWIRDGTAAFRPWTLALLLYAESFLSHLFILRQIIVNEKQTILSILENFTYLPADTTRKIFNNQTVFCTQRWSVSWWWPGIFRSILYSFVYIMAMLLKKLGRPIELNLVTNLFSWTFDLEIVHWHFLLTYHLRIVRHHGDYYNDRCHCGDHDGYPSLVPLPVPPQPCRFEIRKTTI